MISTEGLYNIHQLLCALELQAGDRCMIKYMEQTQVIEVAAPQFFEEIRKRSSALQRLGPAGRHISIIGKNSYDWLVSFCAVLDADDVAVLLNQQDSPEEIAAAAGHTDLDAILFDQETRDAVCRAELPEGVLRLSVEMEEQTQGASRGQTQPGGKARGEDLACILFTSGTEEKRKAVMLSHRALIASFTNQMIGYSFTAQLSILPFHHLAGFGTALNTLCLGGVLCIGEELKYIYRYLECMKPDYLFAVPALLDVILRKLKKSDAYGASLGWNLHLISCGGAEFQPEAVQILQACKITVLQSYGASEAGSLGFSWEMTPERPNTIGKVRPGVQAKIVDGELLLKSDSIMMGYYKDEAGTRRVLQDGWYWTGDLCRQDAEGYFYLTGRKKNLIVLSNGENVSPEEIESRLRCCEDICEVMVGVERGFISGTVFPRFPPECTEQEKDEIRQRIRNAVYQYNAGVPTYKQVQFLHFREEPFVKTAVGKLIRRSVTGGVSK